MEDEEVKGENKIQTGTDQRMVNQKDLSRMKIEAILLEIIEENKGASDATKRATLKEIVWQKISICTIRKK